MRFLRPCRDCSRLFRPTGTSSRYCNECRRKRYLIGYKKRTEVRLKKKETFK